MNEIPHTPLPLGRGNGLTTDKRVHVTYPMADGNKLKRTPKSMARQYQ